MSIGRTVLKGPRTPLWGALRSLDRGQKVAQTSIVGDTSQLPPAAKYEGRFMWVGGTVKAMYLSNGTAWKKVTVT